MRICSEIMKGAGYSIQFKVIQYYHIQIFGEKGDSRSHITGSTAIIGYCILAIVVYLVNV